MGSSGSESVDFAVGSIVWVRRRNGSWWPGKILGVHDLTNNHLMSPRSGTPVKLLGREDASVDWYNLEKSKRVKAFRCGDFDECIEKAESSMGFPSKKREKYARREDAILHALELEKQMLDNHVSKLDIASDGKTNKSSVLCENGSETSSQNQEADEPEGICASPVRGNGFLPLNKIKEATLMPEGEAPLKMRDFPSKRKYSSCTKADEFEKPHNCFQACTTSGSGYTIGRNNRTNFLDDRKVSADSLMEGTSGRGYYRCPPAALVPQKSADISSFRVNQSDSNINELSPTLKQASHCLVRQSKFHDHVSASDDNASECSEDTESKSSDSDDSETDSDEINAVTGRGDEHAIEESEAEERLRHTSTEELDDVALASDIPSAEDGVSNWKLKGKRNIRNTRNVSSSHIPNARVRMKNDQTYLEISKLSVNYQLSNDFDDSVEEYDSFEGDYWSTRNTRHLIDAALENEDYYASDQPYFSNGQVEGRIRNTLIEVDLRVQSSYPRQRVPLISLMSKLDGRAIIGHSLQIEEIAEGASDALIFKIIEFNVKRVHGEGNCPVPSGWKTSRRTNNYRVTRPDLSSEYVLLGRKSTSRNCVTSKFDLNPTKKLSKKGSMSSNQKTRMLSSSSKYDHNHRIDQGRRSTETFSLSEMMKSESKGGTKLFPCIPVKLVFNRLYEAVGRRSGSVAPTNHEDRLNTTTTTTAGLQQQS